MDSRRVNYRHGSSCGSDGTALRARSGRLQRQSAGAWKLRGKEGRGPRAPQGRRQAERAFVSVERCGRWCDLLDALIDLLGLPVPDHKLARRVTTHDKVHVVRERDLARIPRGHVACESRFGRISGLLPSCYGSQPAL